MRVAELDWRERYVEEMDRALSELTIRGHTRIGGFNVVLAPPAEQVVDLDQVVHDGMLAQLLAEADTDGRTTHIFHGDVEVAAIEPTANRP